MASCSSFGFSDKVSIERTSSAASSRVEMTRGDYGSVFIASIYEECGDIHCSCGSEEDLEKADLKDLVSAVMKIREVGEDEIVTSWPGYASEDNKIEFIVREGTTEELLGMYEGEIELTYTSKVITINELVAMTFKEDF